MQIYNQNDLESVFFLCSAIALALFTSCVFVHSVQDLPEFFEDNMETWMTHFHNLLTLDNKLLQTDVSLCFSPSVADYIF